MPNTTEPEPLPGFDAVAETCVMREEAPEK